MDPLIARLGLALAIGLLVGLERGWRERNAPDHSRTAGIRTYGISGLLGGILAALAEATDAISVLTVGFLGFAAIFAWYKAREAAYDQDFSVTSVLAGLAVFALGALAVVGDYRAAAAGGSALAAVLASREILHGLLLRLTWIELRSALILAVMTAIILPLLPNRTVDPWGGLNPWEIWSFTVLTAAISFLGYILTRILGHTRGLLVSALAGAVVSSTAVTIALARTAKNGGSPLSLAGAAALAAMVSILRVCVIVILVDPAAIVPMAPAALTAVLCFTACGILLLTRSSDASGSEAPARNPFALEPLLLFALLFAIVSTVSAALANRLGSSGLLATAALSGMLDVDVAVLSTLRLIGESVTHELAGMAMLTALAANAIGRLAIAFLAGPIRFFVPFAGATTAAISLGVAIFFLWPTL
ncbi:MgtC/SapB family protein [Mesorhizobium sp. CCNWLW179-1]|uniref:MgtC/SapB family protein n=1 Tax=unclassified Mesorhizobium TaxID=325217 RepID=UPI0030152405